MKIKKEVQIKEDQGRMDKYLANVLSDLSRSKIQDAIETGSILVNGQKEKTKYKLQAGDLVQIDIDIQEEVAEPEDGPLDILYEDESILVVNKPADLVVHPAPGNFSGTLVNFLMYYTDQLSDINGPLRPGIVHRLDKDTSGTIVVAKTNVVHEHLAQQFKNRSPLRQYKALVHGCFEERGGRIDLPLARDPHNRLKYSVQTEGKPAITHFEVEAGDDKKTLLTLKLETGRTHQIRVHLSYLNHPVIGDIQYGSTRRLEEGNYFLHAEKLGFSHPVTGEWLVFTSPLPENFEKIVSQLRKNNS